MKFNEKYDPLAQYFVLIILPLVIAVTLSPFGYFLKAIPILDTISKGAFISAYAFCITVIFCEIEDKVKNVAIGSILYGIFTSHLLILGMGLAAGNVDSATFIKKPPEGLYWLIIIIFGGSFMLFYRHSTKKLRNFRTRVKKAIKNKERRDERLKEKERS